VETLGYKIVYTKPKIVWVSMGILSNTLDSNAYSPNLVNDRNMILNSGMEIYELKDVINGDFITGSTPNYSENIIENGAVLLKTVNIYSNYLDDSKLFYISNSVHENRLKRSQLKKGDIILTVIGATDEVVGRAVVYNGYPEKANITQSLCKFGINQKYDNYYISTFINCKYGHSMILQMAASSTRRYINNADLGTLLIPIPSPEIQKYIGDKVRKAEELREEAKRLKKQAEEILINEIGFNNVNKGNAKYHWIKEDIVDDRIDSDFYDLKYQVLIEIEKKFNCYLMEDIIVDKYTGKTPGKEYDDIKGIPLIVVKNVEENILNLDNIDRRIKDNNSFKKTEENDLLITRVGSVGVVSIVEENEKGLFLSDNVICLKLKEGLFNRYIAFYLNSIYGKLMVERWTKGAVQGVINYESINKFKIPIMDNNIMKEIDLKILKWKQLLAISKQLIQEAKQDVEDLIEGNFDMSKVKA